MTTFHVYYSDKGPDEMGRRQYEMNWTDPGNCFIQEPSKLDGEPVGHRRGQVFCGVPGPSFQRLRDDGHEIIEHVGPSPYTIASWARKKR